MMQTVIARSNDPQDEFCVGIIVESIETTDGSNPVEDVITALREAAREFLGTEAGEEALDETCDCFNWGDLVEYLPEDVCIRYGIRIIDTFKTDLIVDHDESLVPED